MDWDDFRYLQAVARAGSVRGAADALGVNASTVVRRLDQLERRAGVKLFARTRQGMQPTRASADILGVLDRVAEQLAEVDRGLRQGGKALAGEVSLAAAADLAAVLLIPRLDAFCARYPELQVRLLPIGGQASGADADLTLTVTDDPPERLVGRRLGTLPAALYGRADRVAQAAADPAAGRWLEPPHDRRLLALELKARHFATMPSGPGAQDPLLYREALRAGLGIGLLPCAVGDAEPLLARVAGVAPQPLGQLWLLFAPHLRGVARVQALASFIQERYREEHA